MAKQNDKLLSTCHIKIKIVKSWLRIDEKVKESIIVTMNTKIQEGIDLIAKMFTKRIGEVGVYAGVDLVLTIIASLPMIIIGGVSILSIGAGSGFNFTGGGLISPEMFSQGFDLSALGGLIGFILPLLIGGLITLLLMVLVVQPILTIVRMTFITSTSSDLTENINQAVKNVSSKFVRMMLLFVYFCVIYLVIGIVMLIVLFILGLLVKLLGIFGVIIMWLVLIAVGVALAYFLIPVTLLAPIDAYMTEKPLMSCIMDAFNATKLRLPLLLVMIVFGIIGGIIGGIFGWIPIPFLAGIIAAAITFCQNCVVFPFYKEYAGITA